MGKRLMWAAIGGVLASILIGIPMHMMGMMTMGPASLLASDSVWVGWAVHLVAGALFGAPFGLLVWTRNYGQGLAWGAVYGLFVGVIFAWFALFSILGMDLVSMSGALDILMHTVWGAILGLVYTWAVGNVVGPSGARRGHARVV